MKSNIEAAIKRYMGEVSRFVTKLYLRFVANTGISKIFFHVKSLLHVSNIQLLGGKSKGTP
jgi:hypothetical protein